MVWCDDQAIADAVLYSRVLWGASMLGMGFVYNWSGLMAARWFLGLAEAGLFPGVNYYLSCWYKRSEFGVRAVSTSHFDPSFRRSPVQTLTSD
jgi:MFS family permease